MAKAARQLGVSHPAVSEVVADLEHVLGVRLLAAPAASSPRSTGTRSSNAASRFSTN
jgi:DNA-binding transcriptional LysR family regulator